MGAFDGCDTVHLNKAQRPDHRHQVIAAPRSLGGVAQQVAMQENAPRRAICQTGWCRHTLGLAKRVAEIDFRRQLNAFTISAAISKARGDNLGCATPNFFAAGIDSGQLARQPL